MKTPTTLTMLNSNHWAEPSFVVETFEDGSFGNVVNATYSALDQEGNFNTTLPVVDLTQFRVETLPLATRFVEMQVDAYEEDDPGHCFYEFFAVALHHA